MRTLIDGVLVSDSVLVDDMAEVDVDFGRLEDAEGNTYAIFREVDHPVDSTVHLRTKIVRSGHFIPEPDERTQNALKRVPASAPEKARDGLATWAATAAPEATVQIYVRCTVEPQREIPPSVFGIFPHDPAFAVEHEIDRLITRQLAWTEAEALRAPIMDAVVNAGGTVISELRAVNAFHASVTPAALQALLARDDVRYMEIAEDSTPDAAGNQEIRWAVQGQAYHDAGIDGSSGTSSVDSDEDGIIDRVAVGVIDNQLDADHPALQDDALGTDRVVDYWSVIAPGPVWNRTDEAGAAAMYSTGMSAPDHGTKVAHQVLGDLLDGQDAGFPGLADQQDRSSLALEAKLIFVSTSTGTTLAEEMDQMYLLHPDIVNNSNSIAKETPAVCDAGDYVSTEVDILNMAVSEGIFWVQTPGNESHGLTGAAYLCSATVPSHAAGAFVVNPTLVDEFVPLIEQDVTLSASRGPNHPTDQGALASSIITVSAPGGRKDESSAEYDDAYDDMAPASSFAAPMVAGGVALLEDYLVDNFPSATGDAGYAFAIMLLMADGRTEGSYPFPVADFDPFDSLWGGGFFRMRLFNGAGLDAPANFQFGEFWLRNLEVRNVMVNGSTALPTAVDHLRAAAWWMEPDLTPGVGNAGIANIGFSLCTAGPTCTSVPQDQDHKKRFRKDFGGGGPGANPYAIRFEGIDLPMNSWTGFCDNASAFQSDWCERHVYVAFMWEDQDRADLNGPCAVDGIGDTGTLACP